MLEQHLRQAEHHVALGRKHIAEQERLVAELETDGHPTETALALLTTYREVQLMHEADRDRLRKELGLG